MRKNNRKLSEKRKFKILADYITNADGSVLASMGNTRVICTATIEDTVPRFLKNSGTGWLTAEYAMIPASTNTRKRREIKSGRQDGRGKEIERIIGRSLRTAIDFSALGEYTITLDCDVIDADGGTRTTAINGAWVAIALALKKLANETGLDSFNNVLIHQIGAISAGIKKGDIYIDLDYEEDSSIDADCNIVINENKDIVDIQATSEQKSFSNDILNKLIHLSSESIEEIFITQKQILEEKYKE
ncbi:MAG: ribonuclease PH [Chloroflexi bacterium]|nr:ribonuclease PH [Chloroflexota bacterium]|tara:strand:- start:4533 stop:5267 length:735 start_codon:yes stop_codon:yes gene_type:complete